VKTYGAGGPEGVAALVGSAENTVKLESSSSEFNLVANTMAKGLPVRCRLDAKSLTGVAVSDDEFAEIQMERDEIHPDWHYCGRSRASKLIAA